MPLRRWAGSTSSARMRLQPSWRTTVARPAPLGGAELDDVLARAQRRGGRDELGRDDRVRRRRRGGSRTSPGSPTRMSAGHLDLVPALGERASRAPRSSSGVTMTRGAQAARAVPVLDDVDVERQAQRQRGVQPPQRARRGRRAGASRRRCSCSAAANARGGEAVQVGGRRVDHGCKHAASWSRACSSSTTAPASTAGPASPASAPCRASSSTALATLLREPVDLTVAGRTDRGVHAWGQVASYEGPPAELRGLNALTPPDISVVEVARAPDGFNARYDARSRTYCYRVHTRRIAEPVRARARAALAVPRRPRRAARVRAAAARRARLHRVHADRDRPRALRARRPRPPSGASRAEHLEFWITADAFMRHMNRTLVGTMLQVAGGRRDARRLRRAARGPPAQGRRPDRAAARPVLRARRLRRRGRVGDEDGGDAEAPPVPAE